MISIHRFNYAGHSSEEFDLCCQLSFDESSGEASTFLSREAVASETYRGEFQRVSSYKYTDVLAPTITLVDKDFGEFNLERQRRILRWLTSKHTPSFITIYHDDTDTVSYEILGAFTEINTYKNGNGRVVGFTGVFTSISPFAFSELTTMTQDVSDPAKNTFVIDIDSDNPESAVYPRITIKQHNSVIVNVDHPMINNKKWVDDEDWIDGTVYKYDNGAGAIWYYYQRHYTTTDASGNTINVTEPTATQNNPVTNDTKTSVVIKNIYTDVNEQVQVVKLRITNNTVGEIVILDGANKVVSSWSLKDNDVLTQNTARIFGDDFIDWAWLPLYNGTNTIEVIGNCEVKFEYREPRKVGEF